MYSVTIGTDESEITQSGDADAQLEMGYELIFEVSRICVVSILWGKRVDKRVVR